MQNKPNSDLGTLKIDTRRSGSSVSCFGIKFDSSRVNQVAQGVRKSAIPAGHSIFSGEGKAN